MIKGIEHIGIYSKDTAALQAWYIKVLDFRLVHDNGRGNYFLAAEDNSMLEICVSEEDNTVWGHRAEGLRHIALTVEDFEGTVEKLMKEKVEVVIEPAVSASGVKTFFFRDPDGNVLHLISRPTPMV